MSVERHSDLGRGHRVSHDPGDRGHSDFVFSQLARTKTKYRNRMLPDNLCSNGIIKLEAINDYLRKGKKDVDIETEMEWEFDELEFDEYDNDGN